MENVNYDLSLKDHTIPSSNIFKRVEQSEFTVNSSSGPSLDNYWNKKMDKFEDNSEDSSSDKKKGSPAWKKGALLFLLMPKGSLIFAPILFKKLFGAGALTAFDFSSVAFKVLLVKAAASLAVLMSYKTYKVTREIVLAPSQGLLDKEETEPAKPKTIEYVKGGLKNMAEYGITFAGIQVISLVVTNPLLVENAALCGKIFSVIVASYCGVFFGLKSYHKSKLDFWAHREAEMHSNIMSSSKVKTA